MGREIHRQLVESAAKWLLRTQKCKYVLLESWSASDVEQPDVLGWTWRGISTLIECKASRSDFLRDKHKFTHLAPWELGMGQRRWYATAKGVINSVDEVPERWGWIEMSADGRMYVKKKAWEPEVGAHDLGILQREFQMLLPGLRRLCKGYGDAPWLKFKPEKEKDKAHDR